MRVSAKTDYALRAMVELAAAPEDGPPVRAEDIAAAQQIPAPFLQTIFQSLRNAGLVESRRGQAGGHRLARPAEEISLAEVMRAVDGPLGQVAGRAPESVAYDGPAASLREAYVALRAGVRAVVEHISLADVRDGRMPPHAQALIDPEDAWRRRTIP